MRNRSAFVRVLSVGIGMLWGVLILFGARVLLNYENAAGTPGAPPSHWPSHARIVRSSDRFTLVMLAHPNCPCTRASLAELEIVMAQLHGQLAAFVLFSKPGASAAEVEASNLWRKARIIPGVSVLYDDHGVQAEQFGGQVSGQTMLYDSNGRLVFSGGITSGRGHQGDNEGADAIVRLATSKQAAPATAPVFGCTLHDPRARALGKGTLWKKQ
jgi:hypothetical protein